MFLRSPKLDEPKFMEEISVPARSTCQISAWGTLVGDYPNAFYAALRSALTLAEEDGVEVAALVDLYGFRRRPYQKFKDRYPADQFLDIVERQDPTDLAELDEVVDSLNKLFDEQKATNEAVKALLDRTEAVFNKYKD